MSLIVVNVSVSSEPDSTSAVAKLIQAVNNGDLTIYYSNAYYFGVDVS
jgi:hypothetical protein